MATIKKYNGSTWGNAVVRKYETKSEIIVPPTTIYCDGSNIATYTIKGNTVQNGTPTPSNPVLVVGVGEFETTGEHVGEYKTPISSAGQTTPVYLGEVETTRKIGKLVLTENLAWSFSSSGGYKRAFTTEWRNAIGNSLPLCTHYKGVGGGGSYADVGMCLINSNGTPIFNANFVADKTEWLAYLQQQYAAGTPVTLYYVLATTETATVNEPLMKIGDYADTLSNATPIPTTEGTNSITVDTAVQPSEFSATWTGWHDSSVKEWDGNDWQ